MNTSPSKPGYQGDLAKTQQVIELFLQPHEKRDQTWISNFFSAVVDASFRCGTPQALVGPDGFPYFVLLLPKPMEPFQCFVLRHMKDDFLLEQGLGVVIEPEGPKPQWVFTYGDIMHLHLTGSLTPLERGPTAAASGQEVLTAPEKVLAGQPSEQFLPQKSRTVIKKFFELQGLSDVHVALVSRSKEKGAQQFLAFDVLPTQAKSQEHYRALMQALAWFLPRHYQYAAMARDSLETAFQPL